MLIPKNGQTHSNKKSVFDHFVGLALKGLIGGDGKNYFKNRGMGL